MEINLSDCKFAKVDRNKHAEMIIKLVVKEKDYKLSEYLVLHDLAREGATADSKFTIPEDNSPTTEVVNSETGEITT